MKVPGGELVSPYDRLVWPEGAIEHLLATGQRRRELVAYLGEAEYEALQPLAYAAAQAQRDPDRCVMLVPGIMGSQLGLPRAPPLPDNLLWLDPVDFQLGHLALLALPGPDIRSLGPVLYSYLPLKLALETAGYTVRYFDYDWRQDIERLGTALATRLAQLEAREIQVIGHSLGGIVGRLALDQPGGERVQRLVTLGTPHRGAYAPVQALRGVYPLVRRVAQLDPFHSAEELAERVFATFPSLYQMLPADAEHPLSDLAAWPADSPRPRPELLARAALHEPPAALRERIHCIAGHGFATVTSVSVEEGEFRYHVDGAGDGTVPLARAVLAGCPHYYTAVSHSELPRDPAVHAALLDLLAGRNTALDTTPPPDTLPPLHYGDSDLRALYTAKIDWAALDPPARRHFLDSLNEAVLPTPR